MASHCRLELLDEVKLSIVYVILPYHYNSTVIINSNFLLDFGLGGFSLTFNGYITLLKWLLWFFLKFYYNHKKKLLNMYEHSKYFILVISKKIYVAIGNFTK